MARTDPRTRLLPQRTPKPISASYLRNVVRWYLERHETTSAHLRRLLRQRVRRAAEAHDQDPAEGARLVDALIAELVASGAIDDRRYAEGAARRLREGGKSARRVRAALAAKGLRGEVVDQALADDDDDGVDPDRLAAIRYARRRRLGPWRRPDAPPLDPDGRRKELASLARAGFDLDVARAVLQGDREALEAELPVGW